MVFYRPLNGRDTWHESRAQLELDTRLLGDPRCRRCPCPEVSNATLAFWTR